MRGDAVSKVLRRAGRDARRGGRGGAAGGAGDAAAGDVPRARRAGGRRGEEGAREGAGGAAGLGRRGGDARRVRSGESDGNAQARPTGGAGTRGRCVCVRHEQRARVEAGGGEHAAGARARRDVGGEMFGRVRRAGAKDDAVARVRAIRREWRRGRGSRERCASRKSRDAARRDRSARAGGLRTRRALRDAIVWTGLTLSVVRVWRRSKARAEKHWWHGRRCEATRGFARDWWIHARLGGRAVQRRRNDS